MSCLRESNRETVLARDYTEREREREREREKRERERERERERLKGRENKKQR